MIEAFIVAIILAVVTVFSYGLYLWETSYWGVRYSAIAEWSARITVLGMASTILSAATGGILGLLGVGV